MTKGTAPSNSLAIDTSSNRVTGWTYDAAGNVTNDGRNTYSYDAESRIVSVNGGATTYTYDASGGRVQKTSGGTIVRYFFGLAENTNGSWTKFLVATPAGVAEWDGTALLYKSNDHLGTARVVTNSSGVVAGRVDMYPYGETWSETGTTTKYKLTGKERDTESGNDYFGARYYWSGAGRWLGVDPVLGNVIDPQDLNRYSYAANDPINYVDPDGRHHISSARIKRGGPASPWFETWNGEEWETSLNPFWELFPQQPAPEPRREKPERFKISGECVKAMVILASVLPVGMVKEGVIPGVIIDFSGTFLAHMGAATVKGDLYTLAGVFVGAAGNVAGLTLKQPYAGILNVLLSGVQLAFLEKS